MAVKVIPKFTRSDIKKAIAERSKATEQAILARLQRIGERFVANARNKADFTDRTGNLRSSIGYVILKDGVQIFENFQARSGGTSGVENAKKVITEAALKFPKGFVIIGVAGMDYAAAVESKGFDVITTSAGIAATSLKESMQQLANKLK